MNSRITAVIILTIVALAAAGFLTWFYLGNGRQDNGLSMAEALEIARAGSCAQTGTVSETGTRNPNSETWWFDVTPSAANAKAGCNPACVVSENGKTSEINWRCTGAITPAAKDDLITVSSPLPNAVIKSPVTVRGEARGQWYFEASFPVKVVDANGKVLASAPAQAQGEWMTTEYVPFAATISFQTPSTDTGKIIFEKDNPSGLPQNDDKLEVPVRFERAPQSMRTVKLYYYSPDRDTDSEGNILCSAKGLVAVERAIPSTMTPIQDTIRLLLKGNLTEAEKDRGITTEFPLQGLSLTGASLNGGVLTLAFSDPQNKTGGGSCRVGILWHQIEATAKQFPAVSSVRFTPEELFQP